MPVEQLLEVVDVGTAECRTQAVQQTRHIFYLLELQTAPTDNVDLELMNSFSCPNVCQSCMHARSRLVAHIVCHSEAGNGARNCRVGAHDFAQGLDSFSVVQKELDAILSCTDTLQQSFTSQSQTLQVLNVDHLSVA
jgi:hypothetical protein